MQQTVVRPFRLLSAFPLFAVFGATLLGCGPGGEVAYEDSVVEYRVHGEAEYCPGAGELVSDQLSELTELLGREVDQTRYHFFADREALAANSPCSAKTVGCFDSSTGHVYAVHPVNPHELVHRVLGLDAPRVLEEGAATLFERNLEEEDSLALGELFGPVNLTDLFAEDGWEGLQAQVGPIYSYDVVGAVARFFWEELGRDAFLQLHDDLGRTESAAARTRKLEAAFGRSLDEIETGFLEFSALATETRAWYPRSTNQDIEPGDEVVPLSVCNLDQTVTLEHLGAQRTVLTVTGEPGATFQLLRDGAGSIHPSSRLRIGEEGEVRVLVDGPDARLRVLLSGGTWVKSVALERTPLDVAHRGPALVILSFAPQSHTPVCLDDTSEWTVEEGFRVINHHHFTTGRPETIECCAKNSCTSEEAWENRLPRAFTCGAGTCVIPGTTYPQVFGSRELPAAAASGRFLVIPVRPANEN